MKKENKNFLYNAIYQLLIYIFPLITIPYISRVLGVDNVGIYSYTYSIVYLFMLVSMLGINNYGNRAISRVRDDKENLSKTFSSIYYFQIIISSIVTISYILFTLFFVEEYKDIFFIQSIFMISVVFDINWFFFGMEKFKITITRNLLIKILSTMMIFIFVKKQTDLLIYTIIMAGSTLLSQIYLTTQLRKYVNFKKVTIKEIFGHFKSCVILFIPVLAFGIYRVMDKTMLGYFSVTELGYYENAEKLVNIPISIINALGTVMLPHMSYTLKNNKENFLEKIYSSMKLGLLLAIAMSLGLFIISEEASIILFGSQFVKSGIIIKFLSITIIISAWANVIRTQYLIPIGNDRVYVISTIGGAIINLIFNLILIKSFGAIGACVGTILAELFVMLYQTITTRRQLEVKKYFRLLLEYTVKIILICMITFILTTKINNIYFRFSMKIIFTIVMFVLTFKKFIFYEFIGIKNKKGESIK